MRIDWRDGFDQAAGHTMEYASRLASGAEFLNVLGPDDAAIVNGTLLSGSNDVVIFSTPAGIYFGSTAIVITPKQGPAIPELPREQRLWMGAALSQG